MLAGLFYFSIARLPTIMFGVQDSEEGASPPLKPYHVFCKSFRVCKKAHIRSQGFVLPISYLEGSHVISHLHLSQQPELWLSLVSAVRLHMKIIMYDKNWCWKCMTMFYRLVTQHYLSCSRFISHFSSSPGSFACFNHAVWLGAAG